VFTINFSYRNSPQALSAGQLFAAAQEDGFRDTSAAELLSLVAEIDAGRPWRDAVSGRYANTRPWLNRIVTAPNRTAFFEQVLPADHGILLDIGAGWGQVSRPLARLRPVVALEPVAERLAFIQAAARQEKVQDRLTYLGVDYLEVEFETRFTVICAIGVFEWVGAFQNTTDPQERQRAFLRKTRRELADGGALILGIENRLGLKYLLGCPDDHIGVPHIACLPAELAARRWKESTQNTLRSFTYSLVELDRLLHDAGFDQIDFFAAFPDYKLPERIITLSDGGVALHEFLRAGPLPPEHNGYDGSPLDARFQAELATQYRALADSGVARHYVPSFFVRAR
jgi:hypothetical protein